MSRSIVSALLFVAMTTLSTDLLAGPAVPASRPMEIAPPMVSPWAGVSVSNTGPAVAKLADGGLAVAWRRIASGLYSPDARDSINVRRLEPSGRLRRQVVLELPSRGVSQTLESSSPVVAALGDRFVVVWSNKLDGEVSYDIWYDLFEIDGSPVFPQPRRLGAAPDPSMDRQYPSVAGSAAGRFAIAWVNGEVRGLATAPVLQVFDRSGQAITPVLSAREPSTNLRALSTAVGLDAAGNAVMVWKDGYVLISGQRFDAAGHPQGENFAVAGGYLGYSSNRLRLAMAGAGNFVIGWSNEDYYQVCLRAYRADGQPAGPEVIAGRAATTLTAFDTPAFAIDIDRHSNVAVFWLDGEKTILKLFNSDLVSQGPRTVEAMGVPSYSESVDVALADDGRIFTTWVGPRRSGADYSVLGRFWRAPKDADLCVFRGGRFLCDTANDGGTAEARIRFGQPGDLPLLADFDGDGRADPCVYREGRLYCDTAHDGGDAEAVWSAPADLANGYLLLGDLDGDGRADPCVRTELHLSCDLDHDGVPDFDRTFPTGITDTLLGDVDGDGRDDICVVRKGRFLCDVAHDGGAALTLDMRTLIGGNTGTLLLGDVDGDGRADPCIYLAESARLRCGLFPPGGGKPASVLELRFGVPGDRPVLGNLDAF